MPILHNEQFEKSIGGGSFNGFKPWLPNTTYAINDLFYFVKENSRFYFQVITAYTSTSTFLYGEDLSKVVFISQNTPLDTYPEEGTPLPKGTLFLESGSLWQANDNFFVGPDHFDSGEQTLWTQIINSGSPSVSWVESIRSIAPLNPFSSILPKVDGLGSPYVWRFYSSGPVALDNSTVISVTTNSRLWYHPSNDTWFHEKDPDVFQGASQASAGSSGLVGIPQQTDYLRSLRGDGQWAYPFQFIDSYPAPFVNIVTTGQSALLKQGELYSLSPFGDRSGVRLVPELDWSQVPIVTAETFNSQAWTVAGQPTTGNSECFVYPNFNTFTWEFKSNAPAYVASYIERIPNGPRVEFKPFFDNTVKIAGAQLELTEYMIYDLSTDYTVSTTLLLETDVFIFYQNTPNINITIDLPPFNPLVTKYFLNLGSVPFNINGVVLQPDEFAIGKQMNSGWHLITQASASSGDIIDTLGDELSGVYSKMNGSNFQIMGAQLALSELGYLDNPVNFQIPINDLSYDVIHFEQTTPNINFTIESVNYGFVVTKYFVNRGTVALTLEGEELLPGQFMIGKQINNVWSFLKKTSSNNLTIDYISAKRASADQTGVGSSTDIIWDTIASGNINLDTNTGVFTLLANKTYQLEASLLFDNFSDTATGFVTYEWVDATTNAFLVTNQAGVSLPTTNNMGNGINSNISIIYTPAVSQTVKIRTTNASGTCVLRFQYSSATIKQLGSSAVSVNTVNTTSLLDDSVTNIKLANMPASTIKGRNSTGAGDPTDLTLDSLLSIENNNVLTISPALKLTINTTIVNSNTVAPLQQITLVDCSVGPVTITAPTINGVNSRFAIIDGSGHSTINNITITFALDKLHGVSSSNYILNVNRSSVHFVYSGTTLGWVIF